MNTMLLSRRGPSVPFQGPFVRYRSDKDSTSDRIVDDLDFEAIETLLNAADDGDAEAMLGLNEIMEARDMHLQQVANTRRASLTGMEWSVDPLEATDDEATKEMANKAADHIRGVCSSLPAFDDCLRAMSMGIGPNLSVIEVIWAGPDIVDFRRIEPQRLTIERQTSEDVRIITDTAPMGECPPPYKFIVHVPHDMMSFMFTRTIARAQAPLWAMKKLAQMDWTTFCEIFGMPVRIGRHDKNATNDEKNTMRAALASMGSKAWGLISENMQFEMKEVARSNEPYGTMIEYIERAQAKGYLGQTLTTDVTGSSGLGGAGAAAIHEGTRRLITEEDARAEERTLRRTLFPWMLRFRFPDRWDVMPIPRFRRIFRDPTSVDLKAEAIRKASQDIGLPVPKAWAMRELKIPEQDGDEALIERLQRAAPAMPGGFG